jgi:hypothetical protein
MNQLTITVLATALLLAAQAPLDPNKLSPEMEKRLQLVANWGDALSTPGTKAEMREADRSQRNGKLMVSYDIYATGASDKQSYSLMQWAINEPEPHMVLKEGFLASDGRLCGTKEKGCKVPIRLGFLPAKAEPFRVLLISKDGKTRMAVMVVPDPIIVEDKGCSLEAVRATTKFEAAIIRGKGFRPNEKVPYQSNSAGELLEGAETASEKGEVKFFILPSVIGKEKGVDEVTLRGSECTPKVAYKWGTTEP